MKNSPFIYILLLGAIGMTPLFCNAAESRSDVRKPAVAKSFYPDNPATLKQDVQRYISAGKPLRPFPRILISPHAGYVFSAPVAGIGYATIDPSVTKVILIGPSHFKSLAQPSILSVAEYETPLGRIPLNKNDIKKLVAGKAIQLYQDQGDREHSLEVQLPFLQVILSQFTIVPVLVGINHDAAKLADALFPLIDTKTLVVISSDFSHFHPNDEAKKLDLASFETILKGTNEGFLDACGDGAIRTGLYLGKKMNLKPVLLDARNSFETAPQFCASDRVVGYGSIVFIPQENGKVLEQNTQTLKLSDDEKRFLLQLARDALNRAVKKEKPPEPKEIPAIAKELCGCFVTLTVKKELRGCIGYIEGIKPLYEAIIDNAKNAALQDPRFQPVTPGELSGITVEVSVLTKPTPIEYTSPEDLLGKIRQNVDGIILKKSFYQSTYLPQVWDQLPNKISFLEQLAMKAGLDGNDWKTATYKKYQAIHFAEK
jgi:AmmeMemoRadiSam system protein B/AmmeMemoRadiSam system protein A